MEQLKQLLSNDYMAAAVWMLGGIVAAGVVNLITKGILTRLTKKTRTELDDKILDFIGRPLFVTVVLVGAYFGIAQLKPGSSALYFSNGLLITIGVLVWTSGFKKVSTLLLNSMAARVDGHRWVQKRTLPLFEMSAKVVLYGGAAYGIFLAWDVDVTAWFASAGILGIAIGFAAKDTLANLFSGIFILADSPYKIGDFIVLSGGERGRVTDIGIRSTRILTRDDIEIIVPNASIANAKIINETAGPHEKERVRVSVGVAYGTDIDKVYKALMEIAEESKYLSPEPEPRVRFRELGDSALKFQLMGWIDEPVLRGRALDELNAMVYKRFNTDGIPIAFPQVDVHLMDRS